MDIENPIGTPVLAVASGTVVVAGDDHTKAYGPTTDFYGKLVILQLEREYRGRKVFVLYGHLSKVLARVGQRVRAGDVLGEVGMTGIAIGPHLHFEVRVGANTYAHTRNPELWLAPLPGHGTVAGRLVDAQGRPIPEALITLHRIEGPEARWYETRTYVSGAGINPDDEWGENFVLGDVPAGRYILRAHAEGQVFEREVGVKAGRTTFVAIRATKRRG